MQYDIYKMFHVKHKLDYSIYYPNITKEGKNMVIIAIFIGVDVSRETILVTKGIVIDKKP